jgi:hypothetical protein
MITTCPTPGTGRSRRAASQSISGDFRPKFLAKTTMARKAADAAISATKNALSRWEPSTAGPFTL